MGDFNDLWMAPPSTQVHYANVLDELRALKKEGRLAVKESYGRIGVSHVLRRIPLSLGQRKALGTRARSLGAWMRKRTPREALALLHSHMRCLSLWKGRTQDTEAPERPESLADIEEVLWHVAQITGRHGAGSRKAPLDYCPLCHRHPQVHRTYCIEHETDGGEWAAYRAGHRRLNRAAHILNSSAYRSELDGRLVWKTLKDRQVAQLGDDALRVMDSSYKGMFIIMMNNAWPDAWQNWSSAFASYASQLPRAGRLVGDELSAAGMDPATWLRRACLLVDDPYALRTGRIDRDPMQLVGLYSRFDQALLLAEITASRPGPKPSKERRNEIAELVAAGYTAAAIGRALGISRQRAAVLKKEVTRAPCEHRKNGEEFEVR